ncbi:MAG TPA: efflux RND transporter periplasmic adaptor subunit [Polyangiaceae bacterium]|nr:efflux RND transporter periplasmic adaptor subunit [Polyangiaceae bacterium]
MLSVRSVFGALCAVVLASSAVWASMREADPRTATGIDANAAGDRALRWQSLQVEAAEAAEPLWSDAFDGLLKLDESKAARVGVPLSGRVLRVYAELGYEVKKGDPLFTVASADLASLGAERRQATLALESAETALARVEALVSARALPERELAEAMLRRKQAELSLKMAQSRQNSLHVRVDSASEFTVIAPRSGRIVEKRVLLGQQLSARSEQTLLTIADLSSLWLSAELFQPDLHGIAPGTAVSIAVPALPEIVIRGEVDTVSSLVDPERRSVPVRVRVDNAARNLKVNLFAKARFLTTPPEGSVSVGASALRSDGNRDYVYVRTGEGDFERRWVTPGAIVAGRALIHEGVAAGEAIAIRGMTLLDNRLALLP